MSTKGAPSAQWEERSPQGVAAVASRAGWKQDANGFWYPATGISADGYMVEDANGFTVIDENAASGADTMIAGQWAIVR